MRTLVPCLLALLVSVAAAAESPIRPGDHVAIIGNTFADQLRIHGYLETLLRQRSSDEPVHLRNLGWGGDMLGARDRPTNFPDEADTLRAHKTDVIVACFGLGESFAGEAGLPPFRERLQALVTRHRGKQYNGRSPVRLVLVSPIASEDHGLRTPNPEQRNRDLAAYTGAMSEMAVRNDLSFVDLFEPTRRLMRADGPRLTQNGIHLTPAGYWAVSRHLADALLPGEEGWRLQVDASLDAAPAARSARGVVLSAIKREGGGLQFTVQEQSAPVLAPPAAADLPPELSDRRDTLVVANLASGTYELTVDGEPVTRAGHADWARGMPIDATPAHLAADALRTAVNDKNLQFTYSWKALNQVHIVGERKSSKSGQALPGEVRAFDRLVREREAALPVLRPKTRTWRLVPVEDSP